MPFVPFFFFFPLPVMNNLIGTSYAFAIDVTRESILVDASLF